MARAAKLTKTQKLNWLMGKINRKIVELHAHESTITRTLRVERHATTRQELQNEDLAVRSARYALEDLREDFVRECLV